jgi:hypothetical protein
LFRLKNWRFKQGSFLKSDSDISDIKIQKSIPSSLSFDETDRSSLKMEDNQEKNKFNNQFSASFSVFLNTVFCHRGDSASRFVELAYLKRSNDSL